MLKFTTSTKIVLLFLLIGVFIFILNSLLIFSNFLSFIAVAIAITGLVITEYMKFLSSRDIEERFPYFLRDVAENMRTGMTLPQAITATKDTFYGALTPHVKRIVTQIDWGVPFDEILNNFSKHSTKTVKRAVSTIIETHRGGGDIAEVFDSVGRSTSEISNLMKERSSTIYSQMLTGYVIFFLFIGILIILQVLLIPSFYTFSPETNLESLGKFYLEVFRILVLLQGFFAGLVIGKMSEGSIVAGIKHSLILIIVGYSILSLFA